ncbi:MAG: 2OG-Fe(II) oxygenase [Rhodospirillales bacterium]|nr:2OG-Fe(II) oxygenase [Rhodospirillales bacterium]
MTILDYSRLADTPLTADPFPHVVVSRFVPQEALEAVVADLPALDRRGSFPMGSLRLGPAAAALTEELEGQALRQAIAAKFGLDLDDAPTMLTLRGCSTERDGHIHRDSAAKRVTVLLYLNPATAAWARHEGCLRLLRRRDDLEDFAVEVPPIDGTLLVFPNSEDTWHGHRTFIGRRYVVQLNYMTTDAAARSELRRHRLSAFVKRLTLAA